MLLKEIEERCSIRNFLPDKIGEKEIKEILEAGRIAPSWMNVQPWHFIVTDKEEHKSFLSKCANFQRQIKEASHVIIVLGDLTAWNKANFGRILEEKGIDREGIVNLLEDGGYNPANRSEQMLILRTIEQCTYAISYMDLQAKHLGIDACIVGAIANELTGFSPDLAEEVRNIFKIPEGMIIIAFLALGYRKEGIITPKKKRKAFNEVVSKEEYKGGQAEKWEY